MKCPRGQLYLPGPGVGRALLVVTVTERGELSWCPICAERRGGCGQVPEKLSASASGRVQLRGWEKTRTQSRLTALGGQCRENGKRRSPASPKHWHLVLTLMGRRKCRGLGEGTKTHTVEKGRKGRKMSTQCFPRRVLRSCGPQTPTPADLIRASRPQVGSAPHTWPPGTDFTKTVPGFSCSFIREE